MRCLQATFAVVVNLAGAMGPWCQLSFKIDKSACFCLLAGVLR